jgi:hypothetical protein
MTAAAAVPVPHRHSTARVDHDPCRFHEEYALKTLNNLIETIIGCVYIRCVLNSDYCSWSRTLYKFAAGMGRTQHTHTTLLRPLLLLKRSPENPETALLADTIRDVIRHVTSLCYPR